MKRIVKELLAVALIMVFALVGSAFAEFEIAQETSYIRYKEPGLMKETGVMWGVSGSYEHYLDKVMLSDEGKFSYGQVDYDGALQSGQPYTISDIKDYMTEVRGLVGYDFTVKTTTLTPYIGFGYRYLLDKAGKDVAGYDREANYWYSPVGVEAKLDENWTLVAEYDHFWKGLQKSHLGDYLTGLNTLENKQKKGYGIRGSVKYTKKTEKRDYIIEPFVKYWNLKDSKTDTITFNGTPIGTGIEPKNNSTEIGIKLAVRF